MPSDLVRRFVARANLLWIVPGCVVFGVFAGFVVGIAGAWEAIADVFRRDEPITFTDEVRDAK